MKIVGIYGKKRAGKDTFATILARKLMANGHFVRIASFAEQIKAGVGKALGFDIDTYTHEVLKQKCPETYRNALQALGALGRDLKPAWWLNEWYFGSATKGYTVEDQIIIVPDVRLPEEYYFLKSDESYFKDWPEDEKPNKLRLDSAGAFMVKVTRPTDDKDTDITETAMDNFTEDVFDLILENHHGLTAYEELCSQATDEVFSHFELTMNERNEQLPLELEEN